MTPRRAAGAASRARRQAGGGTAHHRHRRRQGRRRQVAARRQPRHLPGAARQARRPHRRRSRRRQPAHLRRRRAPQGHARRLLRQARRAHRGLRRRHRRSRGSAWSRAKAIRCGRPIRARRRRTASSTRCARSTPTSSSAICRPAPASSRSTSSSSRTSASSSSCPSRPASRTPSASSRSAFLRRLRDIQKIDKLPVDRTFEGGMPSPLDLYHAVQGRRPGARRARPRGDPPLPPAHRRQPDAHARRSRPRRAAASRPAAAASGSTSTTSATSRPTTPSGARCASAARSSSTTPSRRCRRTSSASCASCSAIDMDRSRTCRTDAPKRTEEQTLYEVLEIDPGASDEEIRRAYKRMREMYAAESMVVCGLYTPERLDVVHARIDEAYDTLLDPEQAQALRPQAVPRRHPHAADADGGRRRADRGRLAAEARRRHAGQGARARADHRRQHRDHRRAARRSCARRAASSWPRSRSAPRCRCTTCARSRRRTGRRCRRRSTCAAFSSSIARFLRLDVQHVTRSYLARYTKGKGRRRAERRRVARGYGLPSSGRQRFSGRIVRVVVVLHRPRHALQAVPALAGVGRARQPLALGLTVRDSWPVLCANANGAAAPPAATLQLPSRSKLFMVPSPVASATQSCVVECSRAPS